MDLDAEKIDEAVLALLWLTLHDEFRVWKSFDWDAMNPPARKRAYFRSCDSQQVGNPDAGRAG
jgi:hypothetical protein